MDLNDIETLLLASFASVTIEGCAGWIRTSYRSICNSLVMVIIFKCREMREYFFFVLCTLFHITFHCQKVVEKMQLLVVFILKAIIHEATW